MHRLPLRWQPASRIAELHARVEERALGWSRQWFPEGRAPSIEVTTASDARPEALGAGVRWYAIADGDARLTLRVADVALERLGCATAGTATPDQAGLAGGLGRRAVAALLRTLVPSAPAALGDALDAPPCGSDVLSRHGAVGFALSIGTVKCELHVNAALFDTLVPPPAVEHAPLANRHAALGPTTASFDAVLELGEIALADSLSLKPGDVIRTSIAADAVIHLVAPGGRRVASGQLVADDGHRALRITRLPSKTGASR